MKFNNISVAVADHAEAMRLWDGIDRVQGFIPSYARMSPTARSGMGGTHDDRRSYVWGTQMLAFFNEDAMRFADTEAVLRAAFDAIYNGINERIIFIFNRPDGSITARAFSRDQLKDLCVYLFNHEPESKKWSQKYLPFEWTVEKKTKKIKLAWRFHQRDFTVYETFGSKVYCYDGKPFDYNSIEFMYKVAEAAMIINCSVDKINLGLVGEWLISGLESDLHGIAKDFDVYTRVGNSESHKVCEVKTSIKRNNKQPPSTTNAIFTLEF